MKDHPGLDRPPGDRDNAVGLARFVLSSMVVLSHSFHLFVRSLQDDPLVGLTHGQYTLGRVAVDAFFVLSGFLVARSWAGSRGLGDFLVRRATRIYPGFLVAVLFTSLVAAPWLAARGGMPRPVVPSWAELLLPALVLSYPELAANGSVWVLSYDFYYYLLLAAIGWSGLLARRWPVLAIWAASWGVYAYWFTSGVEMGMYNQHPRLLTCFLSGAVAFAFRGVIPLRWPLFVASILVLGLFAAGWLPYRVWPYRVMSLVFPIVGAYATLFICFRPGAIAGKLGKLGDCSYGLFLYAYPIQLIVVTAYRPKLTPYTHFLISWGLAIVAARLSMRLIERPAMKLGRRERTKPREVPAPHFRPAAEPAAVVGGG
ncbi:acyltransferase [Paludisphaera sp.]|uniref:acyltransferase family protein n=1 Tax=Paludisphaera sp. TaxID=2017432 RepID=UPI00301D2843